MILKYQILKDPIGMLKIQLNHGEKIIAESKMFVYMKGNIEIKTHSIENDLANRIIANLVQNFFFITEYIAREDNCIIGLSGPLIGDIQQIPITKDKDLIVNSNVFVASTLEIGVGSVHHIFRRKESEGEFLLLRAKGQGELFINTYGGNIQKDLDESEKIIVGKQHFAAMDENINYKVIELGGSDIIPGKVSAIEAVGPGRIYFHTKHIEGFIPLSEKGHRKKLVHYD